MKLLVSTVSAWNEHSASNTMPSLLQGYPINCLACLYIRADISDSIVCNRYFHVIEGRVLKSILDRRIITGEEYYSNNLPIQQSDISIERKRYGKYRKKRNWFYLFAREFVWVFGHWKSKELNAFLEDFHPDTIFFPIESYIHFNRINEYIIKKYHPVNVIGYMWDDNFTYKQHPHNIGYKIHRWWLRYGVKRLVKECDTVFAICPKMKRELDAAFNIYSVLLTKPIYDFNEVRNDLTNYPIKIIYTGKLIYGRAETIVEIVDAIRETNKDGQKVLLQLYTDTELYPPMRERICVEGCCEVKGFVPQSEVMKIQKEADVLLYVESMSDSHLTARLSFSTKITDYLASGACIWAVGNKDLASIEYFKEEDAGLVSTDSTTIRDALCLISKTPTILQEYAIKAQQCGKKNHNAELIQKIFSKAVYK